MHGPDRLTYFEVGTGTNRTQIVHRCRVGIPSVSAGTDRAPAKRPENRVRLESKRHLRYNGQVAPGEVPGHEGPARGVRAGCG